MRDTPTAWATVARVAGRRRGGLRGGGLICTGTDYTGKAIAVKRPGYRLPAVRAVPVLRHRDFRLLFTGQAVSVIGDSLFPIALAFAVLDGLDGSAAQLGLVLAAQVVPMTFLVLVAGVWADRMSRRRLMLAS